MKKRALLYFTLLVLPALLFGNEGAEGSKYMAVAGREYDFVPRVFNFLIFASLTYYLIAEPIKSFFINRKEKIASQLSEIEKRLQKAKEDRKIAEQKVIESERKASEILKDAEKEIELIKKQYAKLREKELAILEKQYEEKMELEERKMRKALISSILNENISTDDIPITSNKVIDKISKKVA